MLTTALASEPNGLFEYNALEIKAREDGFVDLVASPIIFSRQQKPKKDKCFCCSDDRNIIRAKVNPLIDYSYEPK